MDDLDRLNAELHRRADTLTEALRANAASEASCDPDAIARARETERQARIALAELAIGDTARDSMAQEIEHLGNQGNDPATNQRRGLMMLGRFLTDMRPLGIPAITDVAVADTLRQLNGVEGQLLRPVVTGPGRKPFDEVELHLIRRYVLRVLVECASQDAGKVEDFLKGLRPTPTHRQFRGWSQLVPLEEREMAPQIGEALRSGQPLSADQAVLWDEIKDDDLAKLAGYLLKLDPEKVPAPHGAGTPHEDDMNG
jgi:hypothetical protein